MGKSERELEKDYDEYLREVYGETVTVCGLRYNTAYALKELDPTAYDVGFGDWVSFNETC